MTDEEQQAPPEETDAAPGTVDERLQAAVQRARELAGTSPAEHVEIYEDVHRTLQEVLADASGQAGAPAGPAGDGGSDGDPAR